MKTKPRRRKPYRPPRIATDRIYEKYGLACGKDSAMIPNCAMNIKS